jgi:hypothetical protein
MRRLLALWLIAAPALHAQAIPNLHPERVAVRIDTMVVLLTPPDSAERLAATLVRQVQRRAGTFREIQRYDWADTTKPAAIDTLDLDARTLAPRRDFSAAGPNGHEIRIDGTHLVGTHTMADSGVRTVDARAPEPFVVQMMNEAFVAAYPIADSTTLTIPVANPPNPLVRRQTWRVVGTQALETARGRVPSLVVTVVGKPQTIWIDANTHALLWLRWLLPDGTLVWKLPAHDTAYRARNAIAPLNGLFAYFTGRWHCAGAFASGKPIASTATFAPDLEDHWLAYHHDDTPPNRYHALSLWGTDAQTKRLVSVIHDNFGGVRTFVSPGWDGHTVVFTDDADHARFTYTADSIAAFRMRYEASRDSGRTWTLGDSLTCARS